MTESGLHGKCVLFLLSVPGFYISVDVVLHPTVMSTLPNQYLWQNITFPKMAAQALLILQLKTDPFRSASLKPRHIGKEARKPIVWFRRENEVFFLM